MAERTFRKRSTYHPGGSVKTLGLSEARPALPWLYFSSTVSSPIEYDGIYSSDGVGRVLIARRTPAVVPLPATGLMLFGTVAGLGALRARRRSVYIFQTLGT